MAAEAAAAAKAEAEHRRTAEHRTAEECGMLRRALDQALAQMQVWVVGPCGLGQEAGPSIGLSNDMCG